MLLAAPIVYLQAFLLGVVVFSTAIIKFIVAIIIFLLVFYKLLSLKIKKKQIIYLFFYLMFLIYNFTIIYLMSSGDVGTTNAVKAFLYNYSLFIFLFPYFILLFNQNNEYLFNEIKLQKSLIVLAYFLTMLNIFGLMQIIFNSYLLPEYVINAFDNGENIKIDQIGAFVRANSLFKSPLEYGMLNVFVAGVCLSFILKYKNGIKFRILFIITTLAVFSSLSRTVMLMYFSNMFLVLILYRLKVGKCSFSTMSILRSIVFCIVLCFVFIIIDVQDFVSTATNPTNFLIRVANWGNLLRSIFQDWETLLFGFGVVQNGNYGAYHAVEIDNMYIGIIMTGGIIGITLFTLLLLLVSSDLYNKLIHSQYTYRHISIACFSFFVSFLIGGLTENNMHIIYYSILPLTAMLILPLKPMKSIGNLIAVKNSTISGIVKT